MASLETHPETFNGISRFLPVERSFRFHNLYGLSKSQTKWSDPARPSRLDKVKDKVKGRSTKFQSRFSWQSSFEQATRFVPSLIPLTQLWSFPPQHIASLHSFYWERTKFIRTWGWNLRTFWGQTLASDLRNILFYIPDLNHFCKNCHKYVSSHQKIVMIYFFMKWNCLFCKKIQIDQCISSS